VPRTRFRTDGKTPGVGDDGWLDFSWNELLSASISVGRLWDPFRGTGTPPAASQSLLLYDALHRAGAIAAYLAQQGNRIVKSQLYDQLDRSEKMIASYFTGMAVAKVFASHELGVHQLVHIDRFSHPAVAVAPGGPRPDLIAWDRAHGRWVVVEAKGRSSGRASEPLAKMRAQKAAVILTGAPAIRVGTLSYYKQPGTPLVADDQLHVEVIDPPEPMDVEVTEDQVVWCYYRPLVELVAAGEASADLDQSVRSIEVPTADARFGLDRRLMELIPAEPVQGLAQQVSELLAEGRRLVPDLGEWLPDGTWIQLGTSWPRTRDAASVRES
jgi:hypothetical protein